MKTLEKLKEELDDWALDYMPCPIYRIPRRIREFIYSIKYAFQKMTRNHHTSDMELWNLHSHLAKIIYPKFKAFKEMKKHGYPGDFVEYYEHDWKSKEEYDKALQEGKIKGDGSEKWEEVQNEILFAFEYFLHDEDEKSIKNFYKRWRLKNPREEIEENLSISYWYDLPDGGGMMTGEPLSEEEMKEKGYIFRKQDSIYYNVQLEHEYSKRAQKGFELFGKYFMNLWD
jgi:hypothetical protein